MNITLTGKKISQDERILAFKKDNLTAQMTFTVDTDDSWIYKLDVRLPEKCCTGEELFNIIDLPMDANRTCTIDVTAAMVPFTGKYTMQLRGISGEQVYHSDTFEVWVKYSIDPGAAYDPVPSEFYQIEQNVTEMNNHPPKPGQNGYWLVWDITTSQYKESAIPLPDGTLPEVTADTSGKYLSNDGKKAYWAEVQTGTESKIDKIEVNGVEQPIVDKTVNIVVPTKTSDLSNDSGYITNEALNSYATKAELPTKVSQLENDSKFINESALDGYAKTADIPTKTSQLDNDSGYITANDVPVKSVDGATGDVVTNAVKTTTQTLTETQKQQARTNIGAGTSSFDGDYNSLTNKPTIPTKTSQLTNDSGFITDAALTGYAKTTDIPTKTSQLENDSHYITANEAPVTSVNSKTGVVQLNASDVGALPDTTVIPTKTSQLDNDSGFISEVPIASSTQLGGVKIGAGLSVTENGVLSVTGGGTADTVEWNNVLDKPTTIAGYGITDAKIENGTITLGNQTITPLTSAPVTSVNSKTGAVVLTQDDVGDGTTYVRTHNDFTDALKTQINTNKDNIAMAEGDIDGLQTTVGTLQTNVNNVQTQLDNKQPTITVNGIIKGDGAGGVTAAEAGTDYAAPSLGLTGTTVGQVPAVKTIDEQGQPTQWEATALPDEAFIVHFTRKRQLGGNPILTSDRTPEDVNAAIAAKKQVIALLDENNKIIQLCSIANNISYLYFYTIHEDGYINGVGWTIENDMDGGKTYTLVDVGFGSFIRYEGILGKNQIFGTGETSGYEFKQHILFENLPEVTASDNGKFMRVVSGAWAAAEGDASFDITGASTGQSPIINAVDADGKPTAWGAAVLAKADGSNIPSNMKDTFRTSIAALPGVKVYGKADANGKIMAYTDAACTQAVGVSDALGLVEYGNALLIYDHKTYQCVGFEEAASMQGSGYYTVAVFFRSEIVTDSAGAAVLKVETAKLNVMDYMSSAISAPIIITAGELPLTTITTT